MPSNAVLELRVPPGSTWSPLVYHMDLYRWCRLAGESVSGLSVFTLALADFQASDAYATVLAIACAGASLLAIPVYSLDLTRRRKLSGKVIS